MFEGVIPALVTPFTKENRIDEDGFGRNIEFVVKGGVSAIVPCGTTGEAATLSYEEHKRAIDIAISASKVPVIAGTGSNSTAEAIELTRYADKAGADACLVISPYYNKPNPTGLEMHYRELHKVTDLPIILYNVPGRTGRNVTPAEVAKLAKEGIIAGVKEASGDISQISEVIRLTRDIKGFSILSGDDKLTLPILALGGHGVISVAANLVPEYMCAMYKAFKKGDLKKAQEIHFKLSPLFRDLFIETNPIPIKTAMNWKGLAAGNVRLPLGPMGKENEAILRKTIEALGEYRD
ncbi:MAG: 4-hydroxy-tetrahydrodipicolinate synthase [Methanocellales archaeon]